MTTPLRATLKQLGMTRADLARELGITPEQVSRWSTGAKIEAGTARPAAREE